MGCLERCERQAALGGARRTMTAPSLGLLCRRKARGPRTYLVIGEDLFGTRLI
jgi:hypothetical protein